MSYKKFKHNGVNYTLFMGNHKSSSYSSIVNSGGLKSLDVLVLESGGLSSHDINQTFNNLKTFIQYKEIFEKIPKENPSVIIYDIDCYINKRTMTGGLLLEVLPLSFCLDYGLKIFKKEKKSRREFIKRFSSLSLVGLYGLSISEQIINGIIPFENIETVSKLKNTCTKLFPGPILGFRNVIAAKIIEEYITSKELSLKNSDTLKVGIVYGSAHSEIYDNIIDKPYRDMVVSAYKKLGYPGTTREELNEIKRFVFREGKYGGEKIQLDFF